MTESERDNAIILVLYIITVIILCLISYNNGLIKVENQLKTGTLRLFDKQYTCIMTGEYVKEEQFISNTVTLDELPKDVQKKLKEMK